MRLLCNKLLSVNVPTRKYGVIFFATLALLSSLSWGGCTARTFDTRCSYPGYSCGGANFEDYCDLSTLPELQVGCVITSGPAKFCWSSGSMYARWNGYCCSSQDEADSLKCALNPTAEGCAVEKDTTLFGCADKLVDGVPYSGLYRLSCKSKNGVLQSCNGKQNVDIATDGTLVRGMRGTCAQNGFGTGIIGGADGEANDSTETPPSADADCFGVAGFNCFMRDRKSGNTFSCECDGDCNIAIRNLMAGNANCRNPYSQPDNNDSLHIGSSDSGSSSPSSSGAESSTSSSGEGGGNSSDFEYDYNQVLDDIRMNTQYTGTQVYQANQYLNAINNNTETANSLLQAIVNKDWNPTINVGSPNVNVQGDTNIVNVEVTGDTARAPSEILSWLKDTNFAVSTDTALRHEANVEGESIRAWGDSLSLDSVPDMSDSIGGAVTGVHNAWEAIKDTLGNSAIADSMERWEGLLLDNGVIVGSGSDNCPSVFLRTFEVNIADKATFTIGPLGYVVCYDLADTGVTLWRLCRVLLRLAVAIGCMIALYKAVLGIDGREDD